MTVVIDASVAVRWYFHTAGSPRADLVLQTDERIIAPDLLLPEFANAAWKAVAFGDVAASTAIEALADVENAIDEFISSLHLKHRALAIALELRHAAYDCFYLALADQRGCPFVTADERLIQRCVGTPFASLVQPL